MDNELMKNPLRRAPLYYVGLTYNRKPIIRPDQEQWQNGAIPGIRDKHARRLIRSAIGRAFSRIEQKIMKARDVRLEVEKLADNSHEKKRYLEQTLALHPTIPQPHVRADGHKDRVAMKKAARRAIDPEQRNFTRGMEIRFPPEQPE